MSDSPLWMEKVEKMASEVAVREGCVLYDLDFTGIGKGRTLRIFIDKESGVSIDDCSNVSKALDALLDVDDVIPGDTYNLEVSTPGLDRVLKKPWHFQKAIGKKIFVKTSKALESVGIVDKKWKASKTIEEVLESVDESSILFNVKGVELKVPFDIIEKAKVVFELNKGQKR